LARNITMNSSGFLVLNRPVMRDTFAQTITCSRTSAGRTFAKSDGCQLVLGRTRIAVLKSLPGWGRERHSEHSGRAFTGVDAACQCPGAKRSRKAFRALGGTGLDGLRPAPVPSSRFGMARLRSSRNPLANAFGNTGQALDKHPMPQAWPQRPRFRIFAQPSVDQCVYAIPARSGSAVSERKRQGRGKKAKSLPHNKFTHVNAPAASGIPAAPHLGMTCHPAPHAKHGRSLTFTISQRRIRTTPRPPAAPIAVAFRFAVG